MSGGNGGSGGGGGVRGGGGARGVGPQEPQIPGFQEDRTPALSPGWAVQRAQGAAAGGGAGETVGFWMGTGLLWFWPSGACCDCIAAGAGGGRRVGLGATSGRHPELRGPLRCRCAA